MNAMQQGIVTLLRSAVTGEALALPEDFDVEMAYPVVKAHQVATMIFDAAERCGVSQQHPVMQKLFQHYCKSIQVSDRQMRSLKRICSAFAAGGIDYMPLKGSILKELYPRPEMRMMGDADILIRMEQYEAIIPIMEKLGFRLDKETEHELTWGSETLELELHKCLFPPSADDFYAYYGDGWSLAKRVDDTRHAMSAEDSFIYLFTHFVKHFRSSGIGCRHVVDLWVYLRANPEMDEAYIASVLDQIHLREFYENMRRTIAAWFEDAAEDDKVQMITDVIFSGGSWGSVRAGTLSVGVRDATRSQRRFKGRTAYILRRIFPGVDFLRMRYPVLKKAPYLLPGVWLYFLISKSLFAKGAWRRHMSNLSVLTRKNVETHGRMLTFVGLI